jgi:GDP-4-dehydro-6-deoxy-D-mannose reductase
LTKSYQTQLARLYAAAKGVRVMIARTFNLFGAGCSPRLFIGHVEREIDRLRQGLVKGVAVGDLSARRDYLDVEQACAAYCRIIEHGDAGEVYNVASGIAVPVRDILRRLLERASLDESVVSEVVGDERAVGGKATPLLYADVSKLKALPAMRG